MLKGQKSGIIVKVAKEGKFWGTYEGEMVLGGLDNASGVSGRAFHFTLGQFKSDVVNKLTMQWRIINMLLLKIDIINYTLK